MNKILTILITFLFAIMSIADDTVMVNDSGQLSNPDSKTFAEQNNLVSNEVICLRVDMQTNSTTFLPSDAELKVLDKDGKLIYFATTSYNDVKNYHSDDGTWDSNCKIYYYISGTKYAQSGQCSNPKQRHEVSVSQQNSIGTKEKNYRITAVEFYPNLNGQINGISIREIFLNPDNSIIISRKDSTDNEKDKAGRRMWRPVFSQYYRTYPTKK